MSNYVTKADLKNEVKIWSVLYKYKKVFKNLNLKLMTLLKSQNLKTFLQKVIFQIGLKNKLKTLWRGHVISNLKGKGFFGTFTKKNCKKQIKNFFRVEKVIKRKGVKLYVKLKGYDDSLVAG